MSAKVKQLLIKLIVTTTLFGILYTRVDFNDVFLNISKMNVIYIPLIVLFLVLNYVISSFRWKKLLIFEGAKDIDVNYLVRLYFKGAFFNNFMPTSIGGDVYKILVLGKKIQSKVNAFTATFMERFTGVLALLVISYIGLLFDINFIFNVFKFLEPIANGWGLLFFRIGVVFLLWVGLGLSFALFEKLSIRFKKIKKFYDAVAFYKTDGAVLVWVMLAAFIVQFLAIYTQVFIFNSLGYSIPFGFSLFIFPVITLAGFFIPSLNGLGVQDALYISGFLIVGVPGPVSLSASIIYHVFRLLVSLIGGVIYVVEKN